MQKEFAEYFLVTANTLYGSFSDDETSKILLKFMREEDEAWFNRFEEVIKQSKLQLPMDTREELIAAAHNKAETIGAYELQLELAKRLLTINPASADYHEYKSNAYYLSGDYEEALMAAEDGLSVAPMSIALLLQKSDCLASLGLYVEQEEAIALAADIEPSNVEVFTTWASFQIDRGDYGLAKDYIMRVIDMDLDADADNKGMAQLIEGAGNLERDGRQGDCTFILGVLFEHAPLKSYIAALEEGERDFPINAEFSKCLSALYLELYKKDKTSLAKSFRSALSAYNLEGDVGNLHNIRAIMLSDPGGVILDEDEIDLNDPDFIYEFE